MVLRNGPAGRALTLIELVALGLVAERPRHGYDVAAAIECRRLRYWTPIGFSSIYHVLNKLNQAGLLADRSRAGAGVARRVYRTTRQGNRVLRASLRRIISTPSRSGHEVELAMMCAGFLGSRGLIACLKKRAERADANLKEERRLRQHYRQEARTPWTDIIFRHTIAYMTAERRWTRAVLAELERNSRRIRED